MPDNFFNFLIWGQVWSVDTINDSFRCLGFYNYFFRDFDLSIYILTSVAETSWSRKWNSTAQSVTDLCTQFCILWTYYFSIWMNCVRFREALLNWVHESLERQVSFSRFVQHQDSKLSHKVKGAFHSKQNEDYIFCHRLFSKFIFVSWSLRWWLLCGEWLRKDSKSSLRH